MCLYSESRLEVSIAVMAHGVCTADKFTALSLESGRYKLGRISLSNNVRVTL